MECQGGPKSMAEGCRELHGVVEPLCAFLRVSVSHPSEVEPHRATVSEVASRRKMGWESGELQQWIVGCAVQSDGTGRG